MSRPSKPREEAPRLVTRARRWLIPAALLALMPKCIVCVLGWIGLGAALGLGGPELCGARNDSLDPWMIRTGVMGLAFAVAWLVRPVCHLLSDKRPGR